MSLFVFVLIFPSVFYLSAKVVYNAFLHPLARIPGPFLARISSLLSFYHACKGDRHVWLWQLFQLYGHKVRISTDTVVFDDADAYNTIYSFKANVQKSSFYAAWSRNENDKHTLGAVDKELHARKRRLLNLAFTDRSIRASGSFMAKHIQRWLELVGPAEGKDPAEWSEPHDLSLSIGNLVFDVLGDICFGAQFDTKEPGVNSFKSLPHEFNEFFKIGYAVAKSPFLDMLIWLKPRGLDRAMDAMRPQSLQRYYAFLEKLVRQRITAEKERVAADQPLEREDLFHFLCGAVNPDTGRSAFTFSELLAEANLVLMAGSDTTAITASSMFFYLTHNQRAYHKLVTEIRGTFAGPEEIVHSPRLLNSVYLRACIEETLRLAPVSPSELPRVILRGGMHIGTDFYPEGVIVGCPGWAMNRNEELYGDAMTFRPERWIPSKDLDSLNTEEDVRILNRGLHTFLKGPTDCVGQKMAILQLCMLVARTLLRYDVRLAPGTHRGEGRPEFGWGSRNRRDFLTRDAYVALREGPIVQFRPRGEA
ncbi:hypothetical protein NX059_005405 [Plenodomus lindquistii]|nr:hypothetical protein NX059_005405 [Plenodomus lindquistii]